MYEKAMESSKRREADQSAARRDRLTIRLAREHADDIRRQAKIEGRTLSGYIRYHLITKPKETAP